MNITQAKHQHNCDLVNNQSANVINGRVTIIDTTPDFSGELSFNSQVYGSVAKKRKCLMCGEQFPSKGFGNRKCPKCLDKSSQISSERIY